MMHRFALAIVLALLPFYPAAANADCPDLDGAMQICPADGIHKLEQNGRYQIALGIPDPDSNADSDQIYGMAVEIANGCRFGLFEESYSQSECRMAPFEEMAKHWAQEFLYIDSAENNGLEKMEIVAFQPATLQGYPGYMAHYHVDFSDEGYRDVWYAIFMTEISGRHFFVAAFDISAEDEFDAMRGRIEKVLSYLEPVGKTPHG